MPKVDSIDSARPLNWTMVNREGHSISLTKRYDFGPCLHSGSLLRQHELASGKIPLRLRKQDSNLYGKDVLSVKVLVKTVVIAGTVLEEQWSGPLLSSIVASPDEVRMALRITHLDLHCFVPAVRNGGETRIQGGAKTLNDRRERIAEVLVFAPSETMPSHDDTAAKDRLLRVEGRDGSAFFCGQDATDQRTSLFLEVFADLTPIERIDPCDGSVICE
jgi:hypothetical protein